MSPENKIKEKARSLGALVTGIASVKAINGFAPAGHRPGDLLKGAKSVVVLGGAPPLGGSWKSGTNRLMGSVGYNPIQLVTAARQLAYYLEGHFGYYAIPVPIGTWIGHYPYLSLKLCAEMAGLGTRSMAAGIVLNSDFGLLFLSAMITTMPLKEDGPLNEPVCPHESCVSYWEKKKTTPCLSSCPDCLSGEIAGGKIHWMEYRQDCCKPRAQNIDLFQKLLLEAVNEPDAERRKNILFGSRFSRIVRGITYAGEITALCYNCLKRCPFILRRLRKLK